MPHDLASLLFGPARQARALTALRGKPGVPAAKAFLTEMETLIQRRGRMSPVLISLLDEAVKTLLAALRLEEAVARAGLCAVNESGELILSRDALAAFEAAGKIRDRHRKVLHEIEDRLVKEDLRPQGLAALMPPYGEAEEVEGDDDCLEDLSKLPGGPLNGFQEPLPYFLHRRARPGQPAVREDPSAVPVSSGAGEASSGEPYPETGASARRGQAEPSELGAAPAGSVAVGAGSRAVPVKPPVGVDARVPIALFSFSDSPRYGHPFLDAWP